MPQPKVEWRFLLSSVGKDESVQNQSQSNKESPRLESPSPEYALSQYRPSCPACSHTSAILLKLRKRWDHISGASLKYVSSIIKSEGKESALCAPRFLHVYDIRDVSPERLHVFKIAFCFKRHKDSSGDLWEGNSSCIVTISRVGWKELLKNSF